MVLGFVQDMVSQTNMGFQASSHRDVNVNENGYMNMDIPIPGQAIAVVLDDETPVVLLSVQRDSVVAVHPFGGICLSCHSLSIVTCVGSDRGQLAMTPPHRLWTHCANSSMTMLWSTRRE